MEDQSLVIYLGEDDEVGTFVDIDKFVPVGDDISLEFKEQASKYAYIAVLAAQAEAEWQESKTRLKRTYANIDKDTRGRLAVVGGKVTEAMVSAEIELTRGYVEDRDEEQFYHRQYLIMRAIETSMKMRADMLVSLGAQLRNEASQLGLTTKKMVRDIQRSRR